MPPKKKRNAGRVQQNTNNNSNQQQQGAPAEGQAPPESKDNRPIIRAYRHFDGEFKEKFIDKKFKDVNILSGNNPSGHPYLAADREYGYHHIYQFLQNQKPTGRVLEIGPRLANMKPGWHGCAPILSPKDASRWKEAVGGRCYTHDEAQGEDWMLGGRVARIPPAAITVCNHKVQECTCRHDVGTYVSVHSLYYISPDDVVELLHNPLRKGADGKHLPYGMLAYVHRFGSPVDTNGTIRTPNGVEATWARMKIGRSDPVVEMRINGEATKHRHSAMDWLFETDVYVGADGRRIGWTVVVQSEISQLFHIFVVPETVIPSRVYDCNDEALEEVRRAIMPGDDNVDLRGLVGANLVEDGLELETDSGKRIIIPRELYDEARLWSSGRSRTPDGFGQLSRRIKRSAQTLIREGKLPKSVAQSLPDSVHAIAALAYKVNMDKEAMVSDNIFSRDKDAIGRANAAVDWARTPHWLQRLTMGMVKIDVEDVNRFKRKIAKRIPTPMRNATGSLAMLDWRSLVLVTLWVFWKFGFLQLNSGPIGSVCSALRAVFAWITTPSELSSLRGFRLNRIMHFLRVNLALLLVRIVNMVRPSNATAPGLGVMKLSSGYSTFVRYLEIAKAKVTGMRTAELKRQYRATETLRVISNPQHYDDLDGVLDCLVGAEMNELAESGVNVLPLDGKCYHDDEAGLAVRTNEFEVLVHPSCTIECHKAASVGPKASSWYTDGKSYIATRRRHTTTHVVVALQWVGDKPVPIDCTKVHVEYWQPRTIMPGNVLQTGTKGLASRNLSSESTNKKVGPKRKRDIGSAGVGNILGRVSVIAAAVKLVDTTCGDEPPVQGPSRTAALLLAPIIEEAVKRGVSYKSGVPLAGVSTVFAALEMWMYSAENDESIIQRIPAFIMHVATSWFTHVEDACLAHSVFNRIMLGVSNLRRRNAEQRLGASRIDEDIVDTCCREERAGNAMRIDQFVLHAGQSGGVVGATVRGEGKMIETRSQKFCRVVSDDSCHVCKPKIVGRLVGWGLKMWSPTMYRSCSCNEVQAAVARCGRPVNWDKPEGLAMTMLAWSRTKFLLWTMAFESYYAPILGVSTIDQAEHTNQNTIVNFVTAEDIDDAVKCEKRMDEMVSLGKFDGYIDKLTEKFGKAMSVPVHRVEPRPLVSWLSRYPAHTRPELIEAHNQVKESGLADRDMVVEAFIKREWKVVNEANHDFDGKAGDPRVIQGRSQKVKVAMGPWTWAHTKLVSAALHPRHNPVCCMASGLTAEWVGSWFYNACAQIESFGRGVVVMSTDVPRWDSQVCIAAKSCMAEEYKILGAPRSVIQVRSRMKLFGRFRHGTSMNITAQVQSGDGDTTSGNSCTHIKADLSLVSTAALVRLEPSHADITAMDTTSAHAALRTGFHDTSQEFRSIVLGDDGVKIATPDFLDNVGGAEGLKGHWFKHGFRDIDVSFSSINCAEFCSSRFWPTMDKPYRVLGPKIGRVLAKTFYVKYPLPRKKHLGWLLAVCIGMRDSVMHVPILRVVIPRLIELTTTAGAVAIDLTELDRHFDHKIKAERAHRASDETWDMVDELYGITKQEVLALEDEIQGLQSLSLVFDHPILNDIAERDND